MGTYVVTAGPLADEGKNLRDYKKKAQKSEKSQKSLVFFFQKVRGLAGVTGLHTFNKIHYLD